MIGTGAGSVACCHPELVSPVNVTEPSSEPAFVHKLPTCVPVLLRAFRETDDPVFRDVAMAHATRHLEWHLRADGSSVQMTAFDPESGQVVFSGKTLTGRNLSPHQMVAREGEASCRRCHFKGNDLGASAMILSAKSILCMPCHVATFSIGDRTTIFALLIFTVGMGGLVAVWFSGGRTRRSGHRLHERVKGQQSGLHQHQKPRCQDRRCRGSLG